MQFATGSLNHARATIMLDIQWLFNLTSCVDIVRSRIKRIGSLMSYPTNNDITPVFIASAIMRMSKGVGIVRNIHLQSVSGRRICRGT